MVKQILKDFGKYLPSKIVPGIVGFITIPIITRLFPPEDYGNYVLVVSTISVLVTLVGWLSMSIIRFFPAYQRDQKLEEFYNTVLIMTSISILIPALIFIGVLIIFKPYFSASLHSLMYIGVIIFILISFFNVCLEFIRAKRLINWFSFFSVWSSITVIGIGIFIVVVFHFGIDGLLWGSVLSFVIAFPFIWKISIGKVRFCIKKISVPLTSEIAKYGFPLVIGNLCSLILSLSDRYVLALFRGKLEVGIYSASYGISEKSIMLIATLFAATSGSLVFNIWEKEGLKESQDFVSTITRYYLLVCIPAVVGLSVLAKPLINFLFGQEYQEGYRIIPLVVSGAFFLGLQQRFQPGIFFYKKTYLIMLSIFISGLFNLGLNFLLVPKYGYIAAAMTTLVSYVFLLFLMIMFSRQFFFWEFPYSSLIKVAYSSAIMGTIVYFVGNRFTSPSLINLIFNIFLGLLIYIALLFLFREFQPREKEVMKRILVKFLPYRLISER